MRHTTDVNAAGVGVQFVGKQENRGEPPRDGASPVAGVAIVAASYSFAWKAHEGSQWLQPLVSDARPFRPPGGRTARAPSGRRKNKNRIKCGVSANQRLKPLATIVRPSGRGSADANPAAPLGGPP
jgi:hypothetical protein